MVGYGCSTCVGNTAPLPEAIRNAIKQVKLSGLLNTDIVLTQLSDQEIQERVQNVLYCGLGLCMMILLICMSEGDHGDSLLCKINIINSICSVEI